MNVIRFSPSSRMGGISLCMALAAALPHHANAIPDDPIRLLPFENPELIVDLGVGPSVPLPIDYTGDGLMDIILMCPAVPHNGTWLSENTGIIDPETGLPIFKPPVRIGGTISGPVISYVTGEPVVTSVGAVHPNFLDRLFEDPVKINIPTRIHTEPGMVRQNNWALLDYDGNGVNDLIIANDYWGPFPNGSPTTYGWHAAFDEDGNWTNGPLHGYIYLLRNIGTNEEPLYLAPTKIEAAGKPIDTYGMPSPMWADWDGDGDLDLICGEFVDSFTYYENIGTRTNPIYAEGRPLTYNGEVIRMDLCMIKPMAVDFNGNGLIDIICGDEDGRVAVLENTGKFENGVPQFLPPRYLRQFAEHVNFGMLSTPYAYDWDGDGLTDIITGNSGGYIGFIKNLGGNPVRWAAPVLLTTEEEPIAGQSVNGPHANSHPKPAGRIIREQAGPNGSVQGPAEAKWGYSIVCVTDWDGDGLPDLITNGIWGKILWYRNIGTRTEPRLAPAQPIELAPGHTSPQLSWNWWKPEGNDLVTQWRTMPQAIDWNGDGLMDLVLVDTEGYLALYERAKAEDGSLILLPGKRVFWGEGASVFDEHGRGKKGEEGVTGPLRLNFRDKGGSGRRTFTIVDWDGDGILDIIVNGSPNVNLLRGLGQNEEGMWMYKNEGPLSSFRLADHATKPTVIDLDADGIPELLIGAEDGFFYHLPNPRAENSQNH